MVGQDCGEPIQYVRRGTDENKSNDVQKLNDYMASENKAYWDSELSRWRHMVGTSYKICYPDKTKNIEMDECPFGIDVLDPHQTFVVYNSGLGKKPLMGVYRTVNEKDEVEYHCYTNTRYFKVVNDKVVTEDVNGVGNILIIEYPNNSRRISEIELVIGLFDAINKIQSNRLDGIEQFIQALMVFENCQIDSDKFRELREQGAVTVTSEDGKTSRVYTINDQLDQTQTQVLIDDLYDKVLTVLGMPSREQNTGGDTGSAVYLRNGWDFAEKRAENNEKPFEKSEKEFLKIALKILNANGLLNLNLSDIEIKITRSKSDNMVVKTNALLQQLQAGVDPQVALKTCELYPDPDDVYVKSKNVMDAKYGTASLVKHKPVQPSTDPPKGGGEN
jgi:SPP1 family phage portal protein